MYKGKKILAVITARGGSKGLPGKNIKPLLGKPLIGWTIEQALQSKYLDKVIVSTDSPEIAAISSKFGAQVPFLRPSYLSTDEASSIDVLLHAIEFLQKNDMYFDYVFILEPTSPLRTIEDIDHSLEILVNNKNGAESIVGIGALETTHPVFNVVLNDKGFIERYDKEEKFKVMRRQDLPKVYFFEGTIYLSEINALKKKKGFYHDKTLGYVIPRHRNIEIDDEFDFVMAEALMKYIMQNEKK